MKVVMLLALCFGLTTACKKKGQSGLVKFGSSLTGGETCAHESKIVAPSTADQNGSFIEGTLESM